MRRLEGKIALITGANRGIGRGVAEAFAAEGAALTLMARDAALLNETAEALRQSGAEVLAVPADVTDERQVQEVFRQATDRFGRLDILVNNAGTFAGYGPIDEVSVESWDQIIAVNLRGPLLCTREAFRIMKRQRGGRVINIGSFARLSEREK
ncbi:MAG TPA: SDR family NAD(P)-dependent oxidoreductase [Blastocatellia bacterium]|nr:SDR family NAD(P)-dependent oxidoreductase [Blastocatellia bacterium]